MALMKSYVDKVMVVWLAFLIFTFSKFSFAQQLCPAGQYTSPDGLSCLDCAAGTYNDTPTGSVCKPCSAGTASSATALTTSCPACSPGTFSSAGAQTCQASCSAGTYIQGQACNPCPSGSYASTASSSPQCTPCPMGQYGFYTGLSQCTNCLANYYSNSLGATSCTPCPSGQTSIAGSSSCVSPTTIAPTTANPTTPVPTTIAPTTPSPTTTKPTTAAPPPTVTPTTLAPTTIAPTTSSPTTTKPTTAIPGPPSLIPSTLIPSLIPSSPTPAVPVSSCGVLIDSVTNLAINLPGPPPTSFPFILSPSTYPTVCTFVYNQFAPPPAFNSSNNNQNNNLNILYTCSIATLLSGAAPTSLCSSFHSANNAPLFCLNDGTWLKYDVSCVPPGSTVTVVKNNTNITITNNNIPGAPPSSSAHTTIALSSGPPPCEPSAQVQFSVNTNSFINALNIIHINFYNSTQLLSYLNSLFAVSVDVNIKRISSSISTASSVESVITVLVSPNDNCAPPASATVASLLFAQVSSNSSALYYSPVGNSIIFGSWSYSLVDFVSSMFGISPVIVIIIALAFCVSFVLFFFIHKYRYPQAEVIPLAFFFVSLINFVSLVGFAYSVIKYGVQYSNTIFVILGYISVTCFSLTLLINISISYFLILSERRRSAASLKWFEDHLLLRRFIYFAACFDVENILIINSKLFYSNHFSAPLSDQFNTNIKLSGAVSLVTMNLSQIIITGILIHLNETSSSVQQADDGLAKILLGVAIFVSIFKVIKFTYICGYRQSRSVDGESLEKENPGISKLEKQHSIQLIESTSPLHVQQD